MVVNSDKSDRWKSNANYIVFEVFELATFSNSRATQVIYRRCHAAKSIRRLKHSETLSPTYLRDRLRWSEMAADPTRPNGNTFI